MPKLSRKLTEEEIEEIKEIIKQSSNSHEILRFQAALLSDKGIDIKTIEIATSLKRSQIYSLKNLLLREGVKSLKLKPKKYARLLTETELIELEQTLKTCKPIDLGYHTDYWTTAILADLVESKYSVKYRSKTTFHLIFKRIRFSFHKPEGIYQKHDKELVDKWREETKPIIEKYWNDDTAVILCADEATIRCTTTFQKVWLPIGEYPHIEVSNIKKNLSLYGFLNVKTGEESIFSTKNKQTMYQTKDILVKVRDIYPDKTIVLVWDNAAWHKGSVVQNYINLEDKNIVQINFPPYSPEENPQEHVWKEIRRECLHNQYTPEEKLDQKFEEIEGFTKQRPFMYKLLGFGI